VAVDLAGAVVKVQVSIYADAHDVGGPVSIEEARAEECPACGAAKGQPCTAMTDKFEYEQQKHRRDWGGPKKLVRAKGTPMPGYCHPERRSAARERFRRAKQAEYQRERKAALARLRGPSADALAARAAMLAWDAAEYHSLVTWWREHGHIVVNADRMRPDGSVRGRSYAVIDAEREMDRAFE
jgi:hypothetical protein